MPEDTESGFKWWMRYVIVPIIGGGGIIAIVVAIVERPKPVPQETQSISSPANPGATGSENIMDLWVEGVDRKRASGPGAGPANIFFLADREQIVIRWKTPS